MSIEVLYVFGYQLHKTNMPSMTAVSRKEQTIKPFSMSGFFITIPLLTCSLASRKVNTILIVRHVEQVRW